MRKAKVGMALFASMLVMGMGVGTAWAYFTDSTTAEGSVAVSVEPTTTITEENEPGKKVIRIRNTGRAVPVYVRARVYAPADLGADATGTGWSGSAGEWIRYGEPLPVGEETEPLTVTFGLRHAYDPAENPDGARDGDETNVIVVYECVPVQYDAAGNPLPAGWED